MKSNENNELYLKCKKKNLGFNTVCEVGVYMPETSNVLNFVKDGIRAILVEPDKKSLERINELFKEDEVEVHPVAIYDYNGELELVQRDASTFAKDLPSSPAQVNDNYTINNADTFKVPCKVFNDIDPGNINLLCVDTEGSEWYVIKNLVSRPQIISLETHGRFYRNPFIKEISEWMMMNGYAPWYKTKSDTVYYRTDLMTIGSKEKLALWFMNNYLKFRRLKRFLYFKS